MIEYSFSCHSPASQFVQIVLKIKIQIPNTIKLQLPAWRAGRYQLANYAQNVRSFSIHDPNNKSVAWEKSSKDCWVFKASEPGNYRVCYEYFAAKMDAGSSWIDDQQIYLNLVNCCFEVIGTAHKAYYLNFNFPEYSKTVCTLPQISGGEFVAEDFQQVADSTFLAAVKLTHWQFKVAKIEIHCWIQGEIVFDQAEFLSALQACIKVQLEDFGLFPEKEYHFIYQLLPYKHFHGVEHRRGTVITFGPAKSLSDPKAMNELLGVSAHEFYHAWNVCSIRPKDLFPYDFSKENYTKSGWILEGITSYMGDFYMLKSSLYNSSEYLREMEKVINRVSRDFGWQNQSILESSYDLWLDGYQTGIPDKKQNIYANGALIAWALDIHLKNKNSSLSKIMRLAFERFGRKNRAYQEASFWMIVSRTVPSWNSTSFYQKFIAGNTSIVEELKELLPQIGLTLTEKSHEDRITKSLGLIHHENIIQRIHPKSPAYSLLMIGDEIKSVAYGKSISLSIYRLNGQLLNFEFEENTEDFYPDYQLGFLKEKNNLFISWIS